MAKIAVEGSLTDVKEALKQNGHEVVSLDSSEAANCDCCCITGQDKNVMGMNTAEFDAPVINCDGMAAEEVVQEVNNRIQG